MTGKKYTVRPSPSPIMIMMTTTCLHKLNNWSLWSFLYSFVEVSPYTRTLNKSQFWLSLNTEPQFYIFVAIIFIFDFFILSVKQKWWIDWMIDRDWAELSGAGLVEWVNVRKCSCLLTFFHFYDNVFMNQPVAQSCCWTIFRMRWAVKWKKLTAPKLC